ncbi:MAG: vWA domain-containing protein [Candidatus Bathyarchaeia archaeon]
MDNNGQMRVIEAMIACIILIFGIYVTSYFSNVFVIEGGGELREISDSIIRVIENQGLVKRVIQVIKNSSVLERERLKSELKSLVESLLPPETYYTLSISSGITSQSFISLTNIAEMNETSVEKISLQEVSTLSFPVTIVQYKESKLDVILIIDRSGSMNEKEPGDQRAKIYYAKEAAKAFVDYMNASRDRVGLVSFSDWATLDCELTSDFNLVKNKISNLVASGWTNMGDAVKKANDEFAAHNRTDAILVIVFLTDGLANRPCPHYPKHVYTTCPYAKSYVLNETQRAKSNGIVIYTIGLGANTQSFDEELLKEIQTNGYYYAPSGTKLKEIYEAIAKDLLSLTFSVDYDIITVTLTLVRPK